MIFFQLTFWFLFQNYIVILSFLGFDQVINYFSTKFIEVVLFSGLFLGTKPYNSYNYSIVMNENSCKINFRQKILLLIETQMTPFFQVLSHVGILSEANWLIFEQNQSAIADYSTISSLLISTHR